MKIAVIGLGNMGLPMARNLSKAGFAVVGFDTAVKSLSDIDLAQTAGQAVQQAQIVVTMLPDGQILNAVYDEVLQDIKPGALLIDCSTVDVSQARDAAQKAHAAGFEAIDAPVSGGVGGATDGTLTFMVGGSGAAVERARPLLDVMGRKIVHCGPAGAGQAAKLCNNMLLGISMLGVCEAFALADRLGLDRQAFFDVASQSSGQCWSLSTYCPAPGVGPETAADNGYRPGFATGLMLKDLTLAQASAQATGAPTRLGELATEIYQAFAEDGNGGRDFSAYLDKIGAPEFTHE